MADSSSEDHRFRQLTGVSQVLSNITLASLAIIGLLWGGDVPSYSGVALFVEQYLAVLLGLAIAATFILVPARNVRETAIPWYDLVLVAAALGIAGYVAVLYPSMASTLSDTSPDRLIISAIGMLVILEATRRLFGWVLVIIALTVLVYAAFAHLFPGLFYSRASSFERILVYNYLDSNGVYGIALKVVGTIIIAFIFFGVCLLMVGGEAFFNQFASALMGRYRGGSAKISIVSSLLFGTVSGSAVANVVVSGSVTINMMKRNGYPAHMAAAVEAVASTGGQITPPVMGITAFLIAENLNMSYGAVALAALLPAMMYYLSLFLQVDFEAAKLGLKGLPQSELPRVADALRQGWVFLLPIGLLIYLLIIANFPPNVAGIAAGIMTLIVPLLYRTEHLKPKNLFLLMVRTGKALIGIIVVCALAGIVMGALNLSGILFKMTLILSSISFGHPIILLAIVAVICIVLGMGLPSIVIYVLLSVLIAPALVEFGIEPISAHFFIYYFGMLSMITPPICLATFGAMAIADSKLWPTGLAGMRFGIAAYVMPFVFVFFPELVLIGTLPNIVIATLTAAVGIGALSVGIVGYMFQPLGALSRVVFIFAGTALMSAPTSMTYIAINLAAAGIILLLFLYLIFQHRQGQVQTT